MSLAPGHFWQVGLSLSAYSIGSPLWPALTLFDAQGNVIKTATVGSATDPVDPYLFSGLSSGTYYVGVSASTNLPYTSGGYDPVNGTQELAGLNQAGGAVPAQPARRPLRPGHSHVEFQAQPGGLARGEPYRTDHVLLRPDRRG